MGMPLSSIALGEQLASALFQCTLHDCKRILTAAVVNKDGKPEGYGLCSVCTWKHLVEERLGP